MIILNSITKKFNNFTAVKQVSLEINKGEIFGLLGENGAGKTTTLRMIATMLTPTSGTANVCGFDVQKNSEKVREKIGILFGGETGLYERLTARENIEYFGKLNDVDKTVLKTRINELTKAFGMEDFIDKRVGNFSKGMKQKAAIARSMVHNPDVMLFDEPTSGLDVTAMIDVHNVILNCKNQGKTILLSSHIMEEVEKLCDRVGIIHKGILVDVGTVEELKNKYGKNSMQEVFVSLVGEKNEF